jgi:tryptophan 7-halogenase
MKKIIVIGGGTAGWLTALYAKQQLPNDEVILIESKDIGILGAGEGSVPVLVKVLDQLSIPVSKLIKETKSTIKNSVKFTNWSSKKNHFYHHSFDIITPQLSHYGLNLESFPDGASVGRIMTVNNTDSFSDYDFVGRVSEENKILLNYSSKFNSLNNDISDFDIHQYFSLHFDARNLAAMLSEIGEQRGIERVEGRVKNFIQDTDGYVTTVVLEDGSNINADFIFDCSGFARLLIGKLYQTKWESFKKNLPMKKAIPFFIDIDQENIPPYTESIAMNYGWMWKIPLQHRYGCGYVFDSDFISEEDAKIEVEKKLGFEVDSPKTFSFDPGVFESVWVKNCLAIGLASGFVEPLEATSISQAMILLEDFFNQKQKIFDKDQTYINHFNKKYFDETSSIRNFLYMHYMTDKKNTPFWENFTKNNEMPEKLKEIVYHLNNSILSKDLMNDGQIGVSNYFTIAHGVGLLDKNNISNIYNAFNLDRYKDTLSAQRSLQDRFSKNFVSHSEFLRHLGGLQN